MGFSDLGSFGGEIETPNLDELARNGLRFTQSYAVLHDRALLADPRGAPDRVLRAARLWLLKARQFALDAESVAGPR